MQPRSRSLSTALLVGVALLTSLALGVGVSAKPGAGRHGATLESQIAKLGLTPETQAAVQKIIDAARPQGETLRQQAREDQEKLRTLVNKDPADESAVMAQADVAGAAMTAQRKHELHTLLEVRALLTSEQRARLSEEMLHQRRMRY